MIIMLVSWDAGAGGTERLEAPLPVAEVIAGDLVRLADGRVVRLAGIRVPATTRGRRRGALRRAGAGELSGLLDAQLVTLALAEAPYDRYGRVVAHLERADGLWLQGALLERGLAQVQTRPGEAARADEMLALEQDPRRAARPVGRARVHGAGCDRAPRSTGRFGSCAGGCCGSRRPSATCT